MITEHYQPNDLPDVLPTGLQPSYEKLSIKAKRLYDILPPTSWMTKQNLSRAIGCRSSDIKYLKNELEEAGLVKIYFNRNGNRSNPRHEIIKTSRIGTPICEHISRSFALELWMQLERTQLIECYLKSGWNILPFEPRAKRPVKGFSAIDWKRRTPASKINYFFDNPDVNVGLVVCSHMVVVDVDTKENDWITCKGFQNTLVVSTPRGYHFYFRNDAVVTTSVKTLPNIDTRGPDSYVVLPPSIHSTGAAYNWANLLKPNHLPIEFRREWRERDFELSKFSSREALLAEIPQGMRNSTLWSYGRSLRCRGKNAYEIEAELLEINRQRCTPKLSVFEVKKLAAHIWAHPDKRKFVYKAA